MDSISTVGSYPVNAAGQSGLTINSQTQQQNTESRYAEGMGDPIVLQTVKISQEAYAKFQAFTEKQAADYAASLPQRTAEGATVVQPGPISEEEQTRRTEAMEADKNKFFADDVKKSNLAWAQLSTVTKHIDSTFSSFIDQLAQDNPDLAGVIFGFSVNKDGTLFVTQSEGLNREQINRLEKALNDSDELVSAANDLADAQIAVFDATHGFNTEKTLNRDNYGQTIDMGIDILTRFLARSAPHDESAGDIHLRNWNSNWYNQL